MPYESPTPEDLQARYPAFAAVAEETIQLWLTDAERFVNDTWIETDYQPALMSHAAHSMALLGIGTASAAAAIPAGVTRFKSGQVDVSISDGAANQSAKGGYSSTVYGREFLRLSRRSNCSPRLVPETVPACEYPLYP